MSTYKRIKELREDSDLTQKRMSEYMHISQRAYSHYENGDRSLPVDILIEIAKFHEVSVDYILELTDDPSVKH